MKRFIHLLYWLAVAALLLAGCDRQQNEYWEADPAFSHSYIPGFLITQTIGVEWRSNPKSIRLWSTGIRIDAPLSDSLYAHFGDTSFDNLLSDSDQRHFYLSEEFTAIEVTSDRDFDAAHPAGTSLGDLLVFFGLSAYPYIKTGYDDKFLALAREESREEFYSMGFRGSSFRRFGDMPIKKLLKDVTAEDLRLLAAPTALLRFTAPPSAGKHTFTITFRSPEKTLVSTLAVEIE